MRKLIFTFLLTLLVLGNHPPTSAATTNNDIHVSTKLLIYFDGIEDTSGKDGMYDNGTSYIPKTIIYADTTYVPIRYFANMLGISQVGWDGDIPLVWVNSAKPVLKEMPTKRQATIVKGSIVTDLKQVKPMQFTIFPGLKLYFHGEEDASGSQGLFFNGSRDIPTTLIYQGATYVPLRYFATKVGIPNDQVHWDPKGPTLSIGGDAPAAKNPIVTIEMDNGNKITIELYPAKAPNTVANFISLIHKGFYDGLIFHRVIPGFVIQGGDPTGTGGGDPGYSITGEFASNQFAENDILHERGVLSMARAQAPNSAGSQFFIMLDTQRHLDGQYAAFGKVLTGIGAVDQIVAATTDHMDRPLETQMMKTVTVDTFGKVYGAPVTLQ